MLLYAKKQESLCFKTFLYSLLNQVELFSTCLETACMKGKQYCNLSLLEWDCYIFHFYNIIQFNVHDICKNHQIIPDWKQYLTIVVLHLKTPCVGKEFDCHEMWLKISKKIYSFMKSTFVILLHVKQNKMNIVILNAFLINKTNELFIFY